MIAARPEEGTVGIDQWRGVLKDRKFGGMLGGLLEIMLVASFYDLQMVRMKSLENELSIGH